MQNDCKNEYALRKLSKDEIPKWLDLCVLGFSQKKFPPSRAHFANHWDHDPCNIQLPIYVAEHIATKELVASVRLFKRKLYVVGKVFSVFGIGEVCALEMHRGKQLAQKLMNLAQDFCREEMDFGVLHTSTAIGFYEKLGWKSVEKEIVVGKIVGFDEKKSRELMVECVEFNSSEFVDDQVLSEVMAIYEDYCKRCNVSGCVSRNYDDKNDSEFYWRNWVLAKGRRLVCLRDTASRKICAYLIENLENRNPLKTLCEIAVSSLEDDKRCGLLMSFLLDSMESFSIPKFIYTRYLTEFCREIETLTDLGSMYYSSKVRIEDLTMENHAFWQSDSF
jgi:GNAT superfamily N-acetyltransferase